MACCPDPDTHHSMQCILPPHMVDALKVRGGAKLRKMAQMLQKVAEEARTLRAEAAPPSAFRGGVTLAAVDGGTLFREVYDGKGRATLPGTLTWSENDSESDDEAVREAYQGAEAVFKLYSKIYKRDSIDGAGLLIVSTVHHRRNYNNAFWNGSQMVYGDGDGVIFQPLTRSLSVVGHEISHGVVQFSGGLIYQDESGALNESFADVFGCLTEQYLKGQAVAEASWLIGDGLLGPDIKGEALRSMKAPGTAYDDPLLGKDPQPYHMAEYVKTSSDRGGVHINSGIPNHAFYLLAQYLGGKAWEKAGKIWYDALQNNNNPHATFTEWAELTVEAARRRYKSGSREVLFTRRAWKLVGIAT